MGRLIDADEQWIETASDNTGYVLEYADGMYCLSDSSGNIICEFIHDAQTVCDRDHIDYVDQAYLEKCEEVNTLKEEIEEFKRQQDI